MTLLQAIILGLIQGLAEFLPISSSGHLILVRKILNINGDYIFFDVMLHVATLFAIITVFWKELLSLFKYPYKKIGLLIIATVPAVVIVLIFEKYVDKLFTSNNFLGIFFILTAFILILTEILAKKINKTKKIGLKSAFAMGLAQAVAIIPGVSRSGSTLCIGLASNVEKDEAIKFTFFMSIPIILGAMLFEVKKINISEVNYNIILVGMLSAFVCGLFAIKIMLKMVSKLNLKYFGFYLIGIGILSFFI